MSAFVDPYEKSQRLEDELEAVADEVKKYPGHHPGLSLAENVREMVKDFASELRATTIVADENYDRADKAEAALREIKWMSWDSGSIPAPEVVSRIYCIAHAALVPVQPKEHHKHPTGDYCIFCRAQWPCEESEGE